MIGPALFFIISIFAAIVNIGNKESLHWIVLSCIPIILFIVFFRDYLATRRAKVIILFIAVLLGILTTLLVISLADKYRVAATIHATSVGAPENANGESSPSRKSEEKLHPQSDSSTWVALSVIFWSIPIIILSCGIFRRKDMQKKEKDSQSLPLYISEDKTEIKIPMEHPVLVDRISFLLEEHGIEYKISYPTGDIYPRRSFITIYISIIQEDILKELYTEAQEYLKAQVPSSVTSTGDPGAPESLG